MLRVDWPKLLTYTLFVLVLVMYVRLVPATGGRDDRDFSHLWLGGRMIVTGNASFLYDPDVQFRVYRESNVQGVGPAVWTERYHILGCLNYPPPAVLFYALLAWLPLPVAAAVNAYLTLAVTLLGAYWLSRTLSTSMSWAVAGTVLLLYYPTFANFAIGQNGVCNATLVIAGWYYLNRRQELLAGLIWGILIYKPNWFCAVAWIPLLHGRWRMLAGMATGAVLLCLGTAAVTGFGPFVDYVDQLRQVAGLHNLPGYQLNLKYSALGLFRKWFGVGTTAALLGWLSAAAVVMLTWKWTWRMWPPDSERFNLAMAASLLAALWFNPHLNHYDLILVCVCLLCLMASQSELLRLEGILLLGLTAVVYLAVPVDKALGFSRIVPIPSVVLLLLWVAVIRRLRHVPGDARRTAPDHIKAVADENNGRAYSK